MSAGEDTGPFYVVIDVAIRDVDRYLTYMAQVAPAIAAAGGRYRARGGAFTTYEGDWRPSRIVLLEFPSQKAWESFYYGDEYEAIKPLRDEVSTARMIGVDGLAPGADPARVGRPQAASG